MILARRKGFTLLEILTAVMLTGILTGLALAPVAATVRRVVEIQDAHAGSVALSRTLAFIASDLHGAVRSARVVMIIKDHEAFGSLQDDTLAVITTSLTRQNLAAGTVVYKVERGSSLREAPPGLYRWVFPGKQVREVNTDNLKGEDGQLVLPGVTGFNAEVPKGTERQANYSGGLPIGVYLSVTRGDKNNHNEESLEDIVVFPN
ncbi:MAG: prepilin-type N-terminal cleavage/methylation domain-containing protein [Synergistaceae bacterium]|nr:prepilin-type N-terminal cleavage/methylation domain-containing protein [Synergistaceae bacterium]